MASSSFRDSMNSLGWSRREQVTSTGSGKPSGVLGTLQSLNPFGGEGNVRLPSYQDEGEGPGAPLPARTRQEEEEGWFARKSLKPPNLLPRSLFAGFCSAIASDCSRGALPSLLAEHERATSSGHARSPWPGSQAMQDTAACITSRSVMRRAALQLVRCDPPQSSCVVFALSTSLTAYHSNA